MYTIQDGCHERVSRYMKVCMVYEDGCHGSVSSSYLLFFIDTPFMPPVLKKFAVKFLIIQFSPH